MLIQFTLSMPNNNSWNGKWTGQNNFYAKIRNLKKENAEKVLEKSSYYYNFGDGWTACIMVKKIDYKTAQSVRKQSKGFYGYKWMIDSIIKYQEIRKE